MNPVGQKSGFIAKRQNRLRKQVARTQFMEMWDDNEYPLAYFITFRTYGTWLHGDERGSIDRYHNSFRGSRVPTNPVMERQHEIRLKSEPVTLDAAQRRVVREAIENVCEYRGWHLHAANIRTNHGHFVVAAATKPERILRDFKAYATRDLKMNGLWKFDHSPWVDGGSKESSVWNACDYVLNGQGLDLPESF